MQLRIVDIRLEDETIILTLQALGTTKHNRVVEVNNVYVRLLKAGDDGEMIDDFNFHPSN